MRPCEVCGTPCNSKYSVCRENEDCSREYQRRVQRKYLDSNRERVAARERERYDPVRARERRQRNLERVRARDRAYYRATSEYQQARGRAYYEANREQSLAQGRQWRRDNRDVIRARGRERRSTVQGRAAEMVRSAGLRAQQSGLPFDLTVEWAEAELTHALAVGCPLLGIEMALGNTRLAPNSPSIDKFRPELGYVQSNCWIISMKANSMKGAMSLDFMRAVLAAVETRLRGAA